MQHLLDEILWAVAFRTSEKITIMAPSGFNLWIDESLLVMSIMHLGIVYTHTTLTEKAYSISNPSLFPVSSKCTTPYSFCDKCL